MWARYVVCILSRCIPTYFFITVGHRWEGCVEDPLLTPQQGEGIRIAHCQSYERGGEGCRFTDREPGCPTRVAQAGRDRNGVLESQDDDEDVEQAHPDEPDRCDDPSGSRVPFEVLGSVHGESDRGYDQESADHQHEQPVGDDVGDRVPGAVQDQHADQRHPE
ncbi:hypothetical protein GS481_21510 [Rhodococcus hoagii]|uniref:hypothetical protein n=1 Tax=Rhodococcus hoagii TaxID=43767 RepID=UPI00111C45B2|nr:hypothetical protein [Prescottella equi]MBU4613877.1 hypothetical protein [Rhodococcus sp. GG48]NKR56595.1 hypothetical protein [Prescottella equi]NKS81161.1 hypothetical protein [Prescottella equi]